ncbi:MAG: DUF6444 domain-containing protein, partial [Cyanobacteriota bacterium]
ATELANLRERISRSSRNSSKPPSSNGPGFKPPERRKGSGRKRGGQPGHPGHGPELLPIERVDEVVEHRPDACRRCGSLLQGEDPEPLRHQLIEIPPITPMVIEHRLHRLICPCCSTSTCASLPPEVEASRYGPKLSGLVGLLTGSFPLSLSKVQLLLAQLLGVELSRGARSDRRQRLSSALEVVTSEAHQAAQQQPVADVDETGAPTGNADGGNPKGRRGWLWVPVTPLLTVFLQGLSRSAAAAKELLGQGFAGAAPPELHHSWRRQALENPSAAPVRARSSQLAQGDGFHWRPVVQSFPNSERRSGIFRAALTSRKSDRPGPLLLSRTKIYGCFKGKLDSAKAPLVLWANSK